MSFSENFREAMKVMGITTKEISLITGIKEDTISSYLKTDGAIPTVDKAAKIAEALHTSVEFLVTGFEKHDSSPPKIPKPVTYEIHKNTQFSETIDALDQLPESSREPILRMISEMGKTYGK